MPNKPQPVNIHGVKFQSVPHLSRFYNIALDASLNQEADGGAVDERTGEAFATLEDAAAAAIARGVPELRRKNFKTARQVLKTPAAETWARALDYAKRGEYLARERYSAPACIGEPFESARRRWRFVENPSAVGLRWVGWADEILPSINHQGWFADTFQDETLRGAVFQLPARGGAPVYVAGIPDRVNGEGGGYGPAQFCISELFQGERGEEEAAYSSAARDCARLADKAAEEQAERSRDHCTAWQAGRRFAELGEEVKTTRADCLAVLAEVRDKWARRIGEDSPKIAQTIRGAVCEAWRTICEARKERAKLKAGEHVDDFLSGFNPKDADLAASFNDGAAS